MEFTVTKVSSAGIKVDLRFKIHRLSREDILSYQTLDKEERNGWCKKGQECRKYDTRPCCPPRVPLLSNLPEQKYFYLLQTSVLLKDYHKSYPKVVASKQQVYYSMIGTHYMTRNVNNAVVSSFPYQAFRVGGCLGCGYKKRGKCKRFSPSLEAIGIDLVKLSQDFFEPLEWVNSYKGAMSMSRMSAIGGIYTNEVISKSKFKEVINHVCNK